MVAYLQEIENWAQKAEQGFNIEDIKGVRRGERLAKRARLEADTEANIQYVRN
jgi:hypothetical protein